LPKKKDYIITAHRTTSPSSTKLPNLRSLSTTSILSQLKLLRLDALVFSKSMAYPQAGARGPPEPPAETLVETARVNGTAAEATLSGTELAWRPTGAARDGSEMRKLELESDVLGFQVEGRALKVATFAKGGEARTPSPLGCRGGGGDRKRGELVVEMESEDAAQRWGDAIGDRFAALGNAL
jgi:sphingosine kinase